MKMLLTPGRRVLLFVLAFVACFCLFSVASALLQAAGLLASARALRIVTVLQDVFVFILPVALTALLVTRQPGRLLRLERSVPWLTLAWSVVVLVVSVPAMNIVIRANANIELPEELARWMRAGEERGQHALDLVMGGCGVGDLVMSLLVVGVMAAFSEELFFRGGLQRILATSGVRPWGAVVIAAVVFSAFHMQFYGFVPRLLLGFYLGLLLLWTKCLWVPVAAHFYNNASYVVVRWIYLRTGDAAPSEVPPSTFLVAVSVVLTAFALWMVWRRTHRRGVTDSDA